MPPPYVSGNEYLSRLYRERADYRALFDGRPAPAAVTQLRTAPCVHLGPPTGELRDCDSCAGRVRIRLMACRVFGRCSVAKPLPGLACCAGRDGKPCSSYAPKPP